MTHIRTLFLLLTVIGPLHMAEQILTRIDEFYAIRALLPQYYALFDPSWADQASVLLITIVWTVVSIMFYALLTEGMPRLLVLGLFGAFAASEIHHVFESLAKGAYDPGVIMSVPYAIVGGLLIHAVAREFKSRRPLMAAERSLA
jgi:uncharacterized membrane protein YeaQ/YmgE (transglycosylase-associated protein family)